MITLGCLHTAQSNIAIFETAREQQRDDGYRLTHQVHSHLLQRAEQAGGMTADIAKATQAIIAGMMPQVDGIIITCSSLGQAVETLHAGTVPVLRVDQALARQAAAQGRHILALCAAPTTLAPTAILFTEAAAATGARVEVRQVEGAWGRYRSGDIDGYLRAIAEAAQRGADSGRYDCIALTQSSMSPAVALINASAPPILTSPAASLRQGLARVRLLRGD
ncbi:hypothetical protein SODG_002090 [Sodalis praecaptivus]|uniref:hypothetical protein n=1 Tax=Sodalis praecaptivus TaxID=1239307 RepID=UPI0027E66F59|nr:hypothetical protein [Sodalis praecaptivus]CAJ0993406.1 hypothetical protein NVIRENTERO_00951 [Sodalis praecaptivus]